MSHPSYQRSTRGWGSPHPWFSQPRSRVHPAWCVYCGREPATIRCGDEHTAYVGEWLCGRCYARLFEGPVLCPQEKQKRHEAGARDGRCT